MNWLTVLRAFAHQGLGVSRHPDDMCRGVPHALAVAHQLDKDGLLYRNPATGYFALTPTGAALVEEWKDVT